MVDPESKVSDDRVRETLPLVDDSQGKQKMNAFPFHSLFSKVSAFLLDTYANQKLLIGLTLLMLIFVSTENAGAATGGTALAGTSTLKTVQLATSPRTMIMRFESAKFELYEKLKQDYGKDGFQGIFFESDGSARGRTAFQSPSGTDISWNRLKRKISIKLLQVLLGDPSSKFVWATGGGSLAAAWGNFHHQSYTAVMDRAVKDVFASVGIQFIGKNAAMGDSMSSPEIALCAESIFGDDFDVLSWDYEEQEHVTPMDHYFYRAAFGPNRPSMIALMRDHSASRVRALGELEDRGMTTLYLDHTKEQRMMESVPDTFRLTETEMSNMPPLIRNFKCSGKLEEGEPHCADEKFDLFHCAARLHKEDGLPGWKWHEMSGNLLALFLVEVLEDAVNGMLTLKGPFISHLMKLEALEDAEHRELLNSELPASSRDLKFTMQLAATNEEDIRTMLFKEPCICHTALLPAETRYRGILNETDSIDPHQLESTELELHSGNVAARRNPTDRIRLVADESDRQHCPTPLNLDHRDFFYVDHSEDWKSLLLPNDAEMTAYRDGEPLKGYIAICYAKCPQHKKCSPGATVDGIQERYVSMKVNVRPVVRMSQLAFQEFGSDCYMLMTNGGMKFAPDANGKFNIQIKVDRPDAYVAISSFIIW